MIHRRRTLLVVVPLLLCAWSVAAASLAPKDVVEQMLAADPFGLAGASVNARLVVKDKAGSPRELSFSGKSLRHDPPFSKSLVRFSAPADLAGAGFLQIQSRSGDDERYLFLPELKRSRRISGSLRASSFMGTDFSFADLDRRDFREGDYTALPDENVGKFACHRVNVAPKRTDSPYSKIESWIRADNFLPLKLQMYDRAGRLAKTFAAQEVKRIEGHWFITKSRMTTHDPEHTTDLILDTIAPLASAPDDEFTVRSLEKL